MNPTLKMATWIVVAIAAVVLVVSVFEGLLLLFLGFVFAIFVRRLSVEISNRTRCSIAISLFAVWSCVVGALILFFALLVPTVETHLIEISRELPGILENLE